MLLWLPGRSRGESREGFFFGGSSILDPFRLFLIRPHAQELFVSSMAGPFSSFPLILSPLFEFANSIEFGISAPMRLSRPYRKAPYRDGVKAAPDLHPKGKRGQ